jgi:DNA-binding LacI/PurR family transcriptional regulator
MAQRPVTSADVARQAQVSRATVSYVLNGVRDSRVSPETRARVKRAAAELGYTPHAMARSLRTGRSNLILLSLPPYPPGVLIDAFMELLQTRLRSLGYAIVLDADRGGLNVESARMWASLRPVGAIVWLDRCSPEAVDILRGAGTSALLGVGSHASDLVLTLLTEVGEGVGACAAAHLAERGYQRIGVVVPTEPGIHALGLERLTGAARVASLHGLSLERIDLAYDEKEAAQLAERWARGPHPGAVFTYNDEFAMLLMRALQDAGMRIPGDIALVGADDLPLCTLLRPRLTSVHLDIQASALAIVDRLHQAVDGHLVDTSPVALLEARIAIREST